MLGLGTCTKQNIDTGCNIILRLVIGCRQGKHIQMNIRIVLLDLTDGPVSVDQHVGVSIGKGLVGIIISGSHDILLTVLKQLKVLVCDLLMS